MKESSKDMLARILRDGSDITLGAKIRLAVWLSLPAILAMMSNTVMEYIDASMVGSIGAHATASIGLVATSLWLLGGIMQSAATGFSVQVAHHFGAGNYDAARKVLKQSICATLTLSISITLIAAVISPLLPVWLGGNEDITAESSEYFLVFALAFPFMQMNALAGNMLRCSGNMKAPSIISVLECVMDVTFNFFLIFPTRNIPQLGIVIPGANLGVLGAALGSVLSLVVGSVILLYIACFRTPELRIIGSSGRIIPSKDTLLRALNIGLPVGIEHVLMNIAQIVSTIIIAPLGTVAIAANSFGITIESLCYLPGYGVGSAATTLVGQSIGAKRMDLVKSFSHITLVMGIATMTVMGIVMYIFAPELMTVMTPDPAVRAEATEVLRIEAFAEPMFAASIICYCIFVGMGKTLIPSITNLASIWLVRITLAACLASSMGLRGVWLAMCIELCVRGTLQLTRLLFKLRVKSEK